MFRNKSFTALAALAVLVAAPLAHAQSGGTSTAAPKASTTQSTMAPAKTHAAAKHAVPAMPRVDLNSASREDLVNVPGIGDAIADKIVAGRPYKSKAELLSKSIVTRAQYAKFAGHVVAKQEPAAASKTTK